MLKTHFFSSSSNLDFSETLFLVRKLSMKLPPRFSMAPPGALFASFCPTGTAGGVLGVLLALIDAFLFCLVQISHILFTSYPYLAVRLHYRVRQIFWSIRVPFCHYSLGCVK